MAALLCGATLGLVSPLCAALDGDRIQLRVSETLTYDDNLFRAASGVTPRQIDAASLSDRIASTSVGFRLDVPYSRQRFLLDVSASDNRFANNTTLDNRGQNALAEWDWGYKNEWSGNVNATETRQLANLAYIQFNTRNVITQRSLTGTADYLADARVKLQGALGTSTFNNSNVLQKVNDFNQHYVQLGAAYVTPPGNSVGGRLRIDSDSLPNYVSPLGAIDNNYRDTTLESYFDWRTTGASKFSGHGGVTHRDYSQNGNRNFTGLTGRAQYDWTPTELSSLEAGIERTLNGILDLRSQFVISETVDLRASWIPTPKVSTKASLSYSKLDFGGDPVSSNFKGIERYDSVRDLTLGVGYELRRWAQMGVNYEYSKRGSNFSGIEFTDRTIGVNLLLNF